MASSGQYKLAKVLEMLDECAPGYQMIEKTHRLHISYGGKWYRRFPKGPHDRKREIQRPHVKKLAQHLEILDCAKKFFNW